MEKVAISNRYASFIFVLWKSETYTPANPIYPAFGSFYFPVYIHAYSILIRACYRNCTHNKHTSFCPRCIVYETDEEQNIELHVKSQIIAMNGRRRNTNESSSCHQIHSNIGAHDIRIINCLKIARSDVRSGGDGNSVDVILAKYKLLQYII